MKHSRTAKAKTGFNVIYIYRLLYTSDISRSIYQNVSPLIQVSGYLPILLDNFQERGKRWCSSEGRGRWLVNNKKKEQKEVDRIEDAKRKKNSRDYSNVY